MQHPDITHINRTGYPRGLEEPRCIGIDSFKNDIYEGDEVYRLFEETFVVEELNMQSVEILEKLGAELVIAK